MKFLKVVLLLILFCSACQNKQKTTAQPNIKFNKEKWSATDDGEYRYRRQMVNDLIKNYQWKEVSKDSLIHLLGAPDDIEGDVFYLYYYEKKPMLGGVMSSHKAITFELLPDVTKVKNAKLSEGAEWGN